MSKVIVEIFTIGRVRSLVQTIREIIEHVREDVSTIDERKRPRPRAREILSPSPAWKSVDTRV